MVGEHKKYSEKTYTIPGMEGVLTRRALNALHHLGIDPSDKESLESLAQWSTTDKLYTLNGAGKGTWVCVMNFARSNGVERASKSDTPCLSVALREARLKTAREYREAERAAELKRIEEQSYAVGSAWGDE